MSEVLEANIFFFITSIAVIVFTILLCVVLYHIIKILKAVRRVIDRIEVGSEIIADDMTRLRSHFAEGSFFASVLGAFFGRRAQTTGARSRTKKRPSRKRGKTKLSIKDED